MPMVKPKEKPMKKPMTFGHDHKKCMCTKKQLCILHLDLSNTNNDNLRTTLKAKKKGK